MGPGPGKITPPPDSLCLHGLPSSVHFPGDTCSSSLRSPEESWSNRSPLFKLPQNFQTMRLLSLSSLGWPIPKREGSQEVEEVIKPFYIHPVFNCFHSRGRKNQNPSYITFQCSHTALVRNPRWTELQWGCMSCFLPQSLSPSSACPEGCFCGSPVHPLCTLT